MKIEENISLKEYNTFGIDALAKRFVALCSDDDYRQLIASGLLRKEPFFVLGGGSNVVFTGDFDGVVVHPDNRGIRPLRDGSADSDSAVVSDSLLVEACAGEVWADFVDFCIEKGWHGLENLAAIPGTVGAAPVQNVGAYGREAKDVVERVHCFDIQTGEERWIDNAGCRFAYRSSVFKTELKGRCLVDRVVFRLSRCFEPHIGYKALSDALAEQGIANPTARQLADTVAAVRHSKLPDPKEVGSAGSFFKNPVVDTAHYSRLKEDYPELVAYPVEGGVKLAAGWLIEHCGWKGRREGRVGVYDKQALVLVNCGGCSGAEVRQVAGMVTADVERKFRVRLECEAIFVGE